MLLLIMYICIYHAFDVGNSINITFSHCVSCLSAIHTMPYIDRCEKSVLLLDVSSTK